MKVPSLTSKVQMYIVLFLASIVAIGLFVYTSGIESKVSKGQELVDVLVTTAAIQPGTSLFQAQQGGLVEVKKFPISSKPANAINPNINGQENLIALQIIEQGQLILSSNFGTALVYSGGLSIPKGFVAITIKAEEQSRVGSFIEPGSIVVAYTTGQSGNGATVTRVVISNAKVLAVGGKVRTDVGVQSLFAGDPAMVTLAVSPASAIRLVSAAQSFPVYLGLLADGTVIEPGQSLSNSQLLSSPGSVGNQP